MRPAKADRSARNRRSSFGAPRRHGCSRRSKFQKTGWSYRLASRTDRWAVARQIALKSDGSGLSRRIWRCHGSPQKTMVMKAHGLPMINGAGGQADGGHQYCAQCGYLCKHLIDFAHHFPVAGNSLTRQFKENVSSNRKRYHARLGNGMPNGAYLTSWSGWFTKTDGRRTRLFVGKRIQPYSDAGLSLVTP